MPVEDDPARTRAERAAAARAARRAAQEAEALRANLHRRKQQARSRAQPALETRPGAVPETHKCR